MSCEFLDSAKLETIKVQVRDRGEMDLLRNSFKRSEKEPLERQAGGSRPVSRPALARAPASLPRALAEVAAAYPGATWASG
jgi:hypothetical protein